jgi:hypothetical protein
MRGRKRYMQYVNSGGNRGLPGSNKKKEHSNKKKEHTVATKEYTRNRKG